MQRHTHRLTTTSDSGRDEGAESCSEVIAACDVRKLTAARRDGVIKLNMSLSTVDIGLNE